MKWVIYGRREARDEKREIGDKNQSLALESGGQEGMKDEGERMSGEILEPKPALRIGETRTKKQVARAKSQEPRVKKRESRTETCLPSMQRLEPRTENQEEQNQLSTFHLPILPTENEGIM